VLKIWHYHYCRLRNPAIIQAAEGIVPPHEPVISKSNDGRQAVEGNEKEELQDLQDRLNNKIRVRWPTSVAIAF